MKDYLGITDNSSDDYLTQQINVISNSIYNYTGRLFNQASYTQTFYLNDHTEFNDRKELYLYHFPIVSITEIKEVSFSVDGVDETILTSDDVYTHLPSGKINKFDNGFTDIWFKNYEQLKVTYEAGYSTIPADLKQVVYELVEQRYNRRNLGVGSSFGNDVQRISIPGTISIDFDYSLNSNERKNGFGMFLGNYLNVVDYYRSERSVVGEIKTNYVV